MKVLALLFFVGVASASFYDAVLDHATSDAVLNFMVGMESVPSLSEVIGEKNPAIYQLEDDVKSEIGNTLKDALDGVVSKIRDALEHGKTVAAELINKARDLVQKLKDLGLDAKERAKESLEVLREKAREFLNKLLEQFGLGGNKDKRNIITDVIGTLINGLSLENILNLVKDKLLGGFGFDTIVGYIKSLFGENSLATTFIDTLKEKGMDALKGLVNKLLSVFKGSDDEEPEEKEVREKRGLKEIAEQIRDFFGNLGFNLKEKFAALGEWVKSIWEKGVVQAKEKIEQLKQIAQDVAAHASELKDEVLREALEFLLPYAAELGDVYENFKKAILDARGDLFGEDKEN